MASPSAIDRSSTSYPCFELSMPSAKCLAITCFFLALLAAAATGALAYTGPALSFHKWQWIQLPLALTALFTISAIIFALKCCCERGEVEDPLAKIETDEPAQAERATPNRVVFKGPKTERSWRDHISPRGDYSIHCVGDGSQSLFNESIYFHETAQVQDLAAFLKYAQGIQLKNFICDGGYYHATRDMTKELVSFSRAASIRFTY